MAYKVYKEQERIIASLGKKIGVNMVLGMARTGPTIRVNIPQNNGAYTKTLFLSEQQKTIETLIEIANFGKD